MSQAPAPALDGFIMMGYVKFQLLVAACEFDVFSILDRSPDQNIDELQAKIGIPRHSLRVLLLGLTSVGLVRRDLERGTYANTQHAAPYSDTEPFNLKDSVRRHHLVQYRAMFHLTESLRRGTNVGLQEIPGPGATLYENLAAHPELEAVFHKSLAGSAGSVAAAIDEAGLLRGFRRLLDVGGSSGQNVVSACHRHPTLHAAVFDGPSVCELANQRIAKEGLVDRITTYAGDIFTDAFPTGFDAILVSRFVEIYSETRAQSLYHRAHAALDDGGVLVTFADVCHDTETGNVRAAALSAYFMALASGEGMAYPAADHERWMKEAGFRSVQRFPRGSEAIIAGKK